VPFSRRSAYFVFSGLSALYFDPSVVRRVIWASADVGGAGGGELFAKRFVKKQQMRWTPRGAHLLLQVRVHVHNDELGAPFQR
jgi:hypothetical protein